MSPLAAPRTDRAPVRDVLLTVQQAAERLGLKVQTVRNWLSMRRIGCIRVGGRVSIPESEVLRLLAEGWRPPVKVWKGQE
jgi:excisionase family DNA binding protein